MNERAILIVDDEPSILSSFKRLFFSNKRVSIYTASSGEEGLKRLDEQKFAMVISDQQMPGMKGIDFLQIVKSRFPRTLRVLMTGYTDLETAIEAINRGRIYRYLTKPWNNDELKLFVNQALDYLELKRGYIRAEKRLKRVYKSLMKDLEMASHIFSYLLPPWLISDEKVLFTSLYEPSRKVGGDLLDVIRLENGRYLIYIGDISGHGVQAALLATAVKSTINMLLKSDSEVADISAFLNRLNRILCTELLKSNYITMIFGILDPQSGRFCYLNAGHPPLFELIPARGEVNVVEEEGSVPLGMVRSVHYCKKDENCIAMADDKVYLFYTDGIFECSRERGNSSHSELGLEGLREVVREHMMGGKVDILPYLIKESLKKQRYNLDYDDFTILALQKKRRSPDIEGFSLPSTLESVEEAAKRCAAFIRERSDGDERAYKAEILLNEFLNNIIIHGLPQNHRSTIYIKVKVEGSRTVITCYDRGKRWRIPELPAEEEFSLEEERHKTSGRGIMIIRQLSSRLSRRHHAGLNRTVFEL